MPSKYKECLLIHIAYYVDKATWVQEQPMKYQKLLRWQNYPSKEKFSSDCSPEEYENMELSLNELIDHFTITIFPIILSNSLFSEDYFPLNASSVCGHSITRKYGRYFHIQHINCRI